MLQNQYKTAYDFTKIKIKTMQGFGDVIRNGAVTKDIASDK